MNPYYKFEGEKIVLQINTNLIFILDFYAPCTNHLSYKNVYYK